MSATRLILAALGLTLMSLGCSGNSVMVFPKAFKGGVLPRGGEGDVRGRVERAAREGEHQHDRMQYMMIVSTKQ